MVSLFRKVKSIIIVNIICGRIPLNIIVFIVIKRIIEIFHFPGSKSFINKFSSLNGFSAPIDSTILVRIARAEVSNKQSILKGVAADIVWKPVLFSS